MKLADYCMPADVTEVFPVENDYDIDLTLPEAHRWAAVIDKERAAAGALVREIQNDYGWVKFLLPVFGLPFRWAYAAAGGLYLDEIAAWASAMNVTRGTATVLNCAYEMSYLMGCTAGIAELREHGLVHLRNLDWESAGLGKATRVFRFHGRNHCFMSVGFLGFVGVLSGMVPGRYSITINWAPSNRRLGLPAFGRFGAAFFLRKTLEECSTGDEAIAKLREERLATNAFYTVCDAVTRRAVVIERVAEEAGNLRSEGLPLVQTNHFVQSRFDGANAEIKKSPDPQTQSDFDCSTQRMEAFSAILAETPVSHRLADAADALNRAPVLNLMTCQQMAFAPANGEYMARGLAQRPKSNVDTTKRASADVTRKPGPWPSASSTMPCRPGACALVR